MAQRHRPLRCGKRALWVCATLAASFAPNAAKAEDPQPGDDTPPATEASATETVEAARAAFIEGTELARLGKWVDARDALVRSRALRSHPVTTYNVAYTERALGHLTLARKLFGEALEEDARGEQGKLSDELAASARGYVDELDKQIPIVRVTLAVSALELSIDGRPLALGDRIGVLVAGTREPGPPERPSAPAFELKIDPGSHTLEVAYGGRPAQLLRRDVAAAGSTSWRIEAPPALAPIVSRIPPPKPEEPPPPGVRETGYASLGVGIASFLACAGVGIAFGVNKSELGDACGDDGVCPSDRADQISLTESLGVAGWVTGATGVANVALAVGLLAGFPEVEEKKVSASVGPGSLGLRMRF